MGKYTDMVFKEDPSTEETSPKSWSNKLLDDHDPYSSAGTEPVGSVTTEITPGGKAPGFGTQLKAATIDDPITKLRVYAKARFPNEPPAEREARYGIHEGEVVYQTDDGKMLRETPDTFMDNFKRGVAEGTVNLPTDMLTGLAAWLAGPAAVVVGGATGEQVRKTIGRFLGEKQTIGENISDMALVGGLSGLGEGGARGVGKAIDKSKVIKAGTLARASGKDIRGINKADIERAEAQFAEHGISPYPPQTTGSTELKQKWEMLEGLPGTADIMQEAKKRQGPQVQQAIEKYLDELGPDWTPTRAGEEAAAAARKSIDKLEKARSLKVKPLYKEAYRTAPPIDIRDVEELVDTRLASAPQGGTAERALKKVQKMLYQEGGEEGSGQVLVNNIRTLDNIKKEIDFMLEGPDASSIQSDTLRQLAEIKNVLVDRMDAVSPEYKAARQMYADLTPAVERRVKGLTGEVAKLEGDKVHNAARKLLDSVSSSPESVARARHNIIRQNPKAWDAVVKTYLSDLFETAKLTTRDTPNIAGAFRDKVVKNEKQRKILHAAMGDKRFDALMDFSDMLKKASRLYGKESQTVGKGEIIKKMDREAGSVIATAIGTDVTQPGKPISRWFEDILKDKYRENLANAMVDPRSISKLKQLKKLDPRSKKYLRLMGAFLGAKIGEDLAFEEPEDFAPIRNSRQILP